MKRACAIILCAAVAWMLSGCNICYMEDADIWIADDIDFYMKFDEDAGTVLGATVIGGKRIDLEILWEGGFTSNGVYFLSYPYPEKSYVENLRLVYGTITKDTKNKYTLTISTVFRPDDNPFPGYDTIAITKYTESEIEWVDGWPVPIEG